MAKGDGPRDGKPVAKPDAAVTKPKGDAAKATREAAAKLTLPEGLQILFVRRPGQIETQGDLGPIAFSYRSGRSAVIDPKAPKENADGAKPIFARDGYALEAFGATYDLRALHVSAEGKAPADAWSRLQALGYVTGDPAVDVMRFQMDANDPKLPPTGVLNQKTIDKTAEVLKKHLDRWPVAMAAAAEKGKK